MKPIRTGRCVLAMLLALILLAGLSAQAADSEGCSITLHFGDAADTSASGELTAEQKDYAAAENELQAAEVQIAVFRVAAAVPQDGSDTYTIDFDTPGDFSALADSYQEHMSSEAVKALAQQAQDIVNSGVEPAASGTKAADASEAEISGLDAGLYLVLVCSEGQDYGTVHTPSFVVTFSPVLVSVTEDGNTDVNLKRSSTPLTRRVSIHKTYTAVTGTATCVFEVTATRYGEVIYDDLVSMTFTGGETERTYEVPYDFPVGSNVKVTEVYAGAGYMLDEDSSEYYPDTGINIPNRDAEGWNGTFSFTNEPIDDNVIPPVIGGSITNKYTAEESKQGDDVPNWDVRQLTDSTQ